MFICVYINYSNGFLTLAALYIVGQKVTVKCYSLSVSCNPTFGPPCVY